MDVLVMWQDGSKNVVYSNELKSMEKNKAITIGSQVRMYYQSRWYKGTVLDIEDQEADSIDTDSSDEIPLAKLRKTLSESIILVEQTVNNKDSTEVGSLDIIPQCKNDEDSLEMSQAEIVDCTELSSRAYQPLLDQCSEQTFIQKYKNTENVANVAEEYTEKLITQTEKHTEVGSKQIHGGIENVSCDDSDISVDVSDYEDPTYVQTCEAKHCKGEVFSACHICQKLLCHQHFLQYGDSCETHDISGTLKKKKQASKHNENSNIAPVGSKPEDFQVEGEGRENGNFVRQRKGNKQRLAKKRRDLGQDYISPKTGAVVAARQVRQRCNSDQCKKRGRQCFLVGEEERLKIFASFNQLGNLTRQREFIVRHVKITETRQKTTRNENLRRQKTNKYYLTSGKELHLVCKTLFLNTLGISERAMRTALEKLNSTGIVEEERRGGRQSACVVERDRQLRDAILNHIARFPRVESHYCRSSSSREYLHPELTISKMYSMFLEEVESEDKKPCIDLYRKVFRSLNLSFHRAKKDQCSLCMNYRQGDEVTKERLKTEYEKHISEKNKVREIKQRIKEAAMMNPNIACASFDLQQVIYLPQSNENAIFYKRRLANYNLTVYDLGSRQCCCFMWSEMDSKRGAAEISTCVYQALQVYDREKCVKAVALFSDGCSGQNKNSITAAMMLYSVANSVNIEEITLRFFESFHGQNEGDSAHSAISLAVSNAGNLFLPSQLYPIVRLARRRQPYCVHTLQYSDFLDFKKLSQDLRILSIKTSETGDPIRWNDIMELKVTKTHPLTIFFKTSHLQSDYRCFKLKRQALNLQGLSLQALNSEPRKIDADKYRNLKSLCEGTKPVIRLEEHKKFYLNIPHE